MAPDLSDWQPLLDGDAASAALAVARDVGERLRDPERIARAIAAGAPVDSEARSPLWLPGSLAAGHAGLAVTFAQLGRCFPGEGWERSAYGQMEHAVAALRKGPAAHGGLFDGLAGVAFAAVFVDAARYSRLLGTLDGLIGRHAGAMIARMDSRPEGCAEDEVDLVSGLAGIGAYALARGDSGLSGAVIARLIALILGEGALPGWYTPPELLDDLAQPRYPAGRMNCGLAHGLPGPLALLSLAHAAGFSAEGIRPAIKRVSAWLVEQPIADEWGPDWPAAVLPGPDADREQAVRAAWCYGTPGVTRALWLAGTALDDTRLQRFALDAGAAVFRRPAGTLRTEAPGLCHGAAGLLEVSARFANDTGNAGLREAAARLAQSIAERCEPATFLGYRDLSPDGEAVERAGLLEGAAGVVLALLAAATPVPPVWDRMLLLA